MTTQSMNHQQALETMAAVRYLLREMTTEERRLFEEHYLECAKCLEEVTFGADFLEAGHEVVAHDPGYVRVVEPVPSWHERLLPVVAGWLRPAPALAFALLLCLIGIGYQINTIHHQQQTIAELQGLRPEFRFIVRGGAREARGADKSVITVRRNTQLSVKVEFMPGDTPYRADILSQGNAVKYSLPLSVGPNDESVTFSIPAEALGPGTYALVIRHQSQNGSSKDVEKTFQLQFID